MKLRNKNLPTYEEAHARWRYDPQTGEIWNRRFERVITGADSDEYIRVGFCHRPTKRKCMILGHRLAWLLHEGYWPEHQIEHIDRDKTHNAWHNLRPVGQQCNNRNVGNRKDNTSGVKGVYWHEAYNNWLARIVVLENGEYKLKHLGYYHDFDDAVCARLAAEQCLNLSGCDSNSPAYRYVKSNIQQMSVERAAPPWEVANEYVKSSERAPTTELAHERIGTFW